MWIDRCFLPFEAAKIKSLPMCMTPQEDILIWPKSKEGVYTVKLGYQLLYEMEDREMASASTIGGNKKFWADLWKLRVPNKVKTFAWRVCTNSLLTMENLLKRKVVQLALCSNSKREPENVVHALWGCEKVRQVWGREFDGLRTAHTQGLSFPDLFGLTALSQRGLELFIMICWSIWNHHNKSRANDPVVPLNKLSAWAIQYLQEFQQQKKHAIMKMPPKPAIWKPPDPSFVKTNFDGAVFEDLDAIGIGVVVRNSDGKVMAALSEIIPKPASVAALETLAARRAVQFVQELDMKDSIFEGDSEVSISAIKSRSFQHPSCSHLIQDIMALAQSL